MYWDKSQLKVWQISKTLTLTKFNNSYCDKTQQLKFWWNSTTLIIIKRTTSEKSVLSRTTWQLMRFIWGSHLQFIFRKTNFNHTPIIQPCYWITPRWRWSTDLHLQKIWTQSATPAILSEHRPSPHLLEISGLLAYSVCLTSHDLWTSETKWTFRSYSWWWLIACFRGEWRPSCHGLGAFDCWAREARCRTLY